ncbi:xanthine dehydrogenase family protein molybdopterin-binding subunit [Actinocorallia sp. A-T 12471]|uniref:xanthine dehydrogenase family protein molybdopterin-binding subunit n=1 Tax=Actinocorallia sp. A-T 12471 TaxID=3089813 RepID=UPI0029CBB7C6|nr:xanthine dehydrogenase family protein molybdopterin-binding subunit [Actinocorallia sp. A-T 12471]MDX6739584.1 xanthine dehydrogenase family protein molybdopterin-binding subunit [Actinocorallia sp. A-T 12471]
MSVVNASGGLIGQPVKRKEDDALLRGRGRFLADLALPGALEIAFVRSPHAHAEVTRIDCGAARALDGVVAVYAWDDIRDTVSELFLEAEMRIPEQVREAIRPLSRLQPVPLLADGRVTCVGQAVVMVVAADRYVAEDAAELVEIDYSPLPALVDPLDALAPDAPVVVPGTEDNLAISVEGKVGDVEAALAEAVHVVTERYRSHRYVASPMETRGVAVSLDPRDGSLTVFASTQTPHRLREVIAGTLRLDPSDVRVTAPDIGGGFGQKGVQYVEDVLVPYAAHRLGRPVRWVEDRTENLTSSSHAREQVHDITLAADAEGRLLALRDDAVINLGNANLTGLVVPYNTLTHVIGPYVIPSLDLRVRGAVTTTMMATPYRGAGRPEAVFAMERAMDRLARKVGIEPHELRARNLVQPENMPHRTGLMYRDGTMQTYDSGNFPELLRRLVGHLDVAEIRRRQRDGDVAPGKRLGVGLALYIEGTGLGPFESGSVTVLPSGRIRVATGASSQGQAHQTVFAQVAADALGVPLDRIDLREGDTAAIGHGVGTIASRSMVTAGNAIHLAALAVRDQVLADAAGLLGVAPEDLEIVAGVVRPVDKPEAGIDLADLAARRAPLLVPGTSTGPGAVISETTFFKPPTVTVASAAHGAIVEVDERTGKTEIVSYAIVHDCGRVVNPMVADGQVTGGVMQGIGGALYEEMEYGPDGQPRSVTYMDYLVPTAAEAPPYVLDHIETRSTLNPLGVKGLGEGGAIAPPAVIANAVEDALGPDHVHVTRGPLTPSRVKDLIRAASPGVTSER